MANLLYLILSSIGLRWLVYEHKAFSWFQNWLEAGEIGGLKHELSQCVYCQTMQAAVVVGVIFWGLGVGVIEIITNFLATPLINYLLAKYQK